MKKMNSETQFATQFKRLESEELRSEMEVDTEMANTLTSQLELIANSALAPIVKVEQPDANLASQLSTCERKAGIPASQNDLEHYCQICEKGYIRRRGLQEHLVSAAHQRMATRSIEALKAVPDEFNPDYYCIVCNRTFAGKLCYRLHLIKIHQMTLTSIKRGPDLTIEPDPKNPIGYCKSCDRTYSTKKYYHRHLKLVHKMVFSKPQRAKPNFDITPDIDDPNHYCKSCQVTYKSRSKYRQHLRGAHRMGLALLSIDPTVDTQNNTICVICRIRYTEEHSYQQHMKKYHAEGINPPGRPDHTIQPNPEDPNFYCASCKRHYSSRSTYRQHIQSSHPTVKLEKYKKKRLSPAIVKMDAGNNNNTKCTICQVDFKSRGPYKEHIHQLHDEEEENRVVEPLPPAPTPAATAVVDKSILPVWDDPNDYCRTCQKIYTSKDGYRRHLKLMHRDVIRQIMKLAGLKIKIKTKARKSTK